MKKVLAILLAMVMVLSLAACGGNNDTPANDQPSQSGDQAPDTSYPLMREKGIIYPFPRRRPNCKSRKSQTLPRMCWRTSMPMCFL